MSIHLKAAKCPGCFIIPANFNNSLVDLMVRRAIGLVRKGSCLILAPSKGMEIETAKSFARMVRAKFYDEMNILEHEGSPIIEPSSTEDTAPQAPEPAPAPTKPKRTRKPRKA